VEGEGGLEADIRPAHQAIGHEKRVRLPLAIGRGQGIKTPAELMEAPSSHPSGQLPSHVRGIDVAGEQEAGLEEGLVPHEFEKGPKVHCNKLP
jgi:hypothetical protein